MSVLVVKRPDMFGFRNPGLMRVPPEQAVVGGNSDCRNRRLQTMFQLVGYGDHAGSGVPKIYSNWAGQHWRRPSLYQITQPEQTLMELHMTSLLPPAAVAEVEAHFGERFSALPDLERLALVLAAADGVLNHSRLRELSSDHPADITKRLARLARDGMLVPNGIGRGTVYFLPWQVKSGFQPELAAPADAGLALPLDSDALPPELSPLTPELILELGPEAPDPEAIGGDTPVALAIGAFGPEELARLQQIALPVSAGSGRRPTSCVKSSTNCAARPRSPLIRRTGGKTAIRSPSRSASRASKSKANSWRSP